DRLVGPLTLAVAAVVGAPARSRGPFGRGRPPRASPPPLVARVGRSRGTARRRAASRPRRRARRPRRARRAGRLARPEPPPPVHRRGHASGRGTPGRRAGGLLRG